MRVRFGPWMPDNPDLDSSGLEEALNCMPTDTGYGDLREHATATGSATVSVTSTAAFSRLQIVTYHAGAVFSQHLHFAVGSPSRLYDVYASGSGVETDDVSRTATYSAALTTNWEFARFGNYILAANELDTMQIRDIANLTNFRDMSASASAPAAYRLATVRDFVFAAVRGNGTDPDYIQWCQINNPQRWTTSPRHQSDFQPLPEVGEVQAIRGGDFAAIITDNSVWRATYVGSPIIFRFDQIAANIACAARHSAARFENLTFFMSKSGVVVFDGAQIIPIGKGAVDRYLLDNFPNQSGFHGIIDQPNRLYVLGVPASGQTAGIGRLLIYNWNTQRWTTVDRQFLQITQSLRLAPGTLLGPEAGRLGIGAFTSISGSKTAYGDFTSDTRMTATFATGEAQLFTDQRGFVRGVRPLIQNTSNTTTTVEVGKRNRLDETVSYGAAVSLNANGLAPLRADARYHRVRVNVTGGFDRAIGLDLDAIKSGKR